MRVDTILDSGQTYGGHAYRDCINVDMNSTSRPSSRIRECDGPPATASRSTSSPRRGRSWPTPATTSNENSIVAMLHYRRADGREFRALLMGDAGEAREAQLLASGVDLRADVLKVGHHGSRYASTPAFVAAVAPALASISVGRHNTFGHPSAETLATLARAGATIYRTDRCGALTLDVDRSAASTMLLCHSDRR